MVEDKLNLVGKKTRIDEVRYIKMFNKWRNKEENYYKVFSEQVGTYKGKVVRASRLFKVFSRNKWFPNGDFQKLLTHFNISEPQDLIGKEVIITQNSKGWFEVKMEENSETETQEEE